MLRASSVFWRSSVGSNRKSGAVQLGDRYNEAFRKYLHGESDFPDAARIVFSIMDRSGPNYPEMHNLMMLPQSRKKSGHHSHMFFLLGVDFEVFVGNQGLSKFTQICLHHGEIKQVYVGKTFWTRTALR